MKQITVWFNKSLSSTYNVIEDLRAAPRTESFRILCTHTSPDFPAFQVCDVAECEPRGLDGAPYLDYCLDVIRRHDVQVFVPGKQLRAIVEARSRFADAGVKLLAAGDANTLHLLESKAALYRALAGSPVPLPDHVVVHDRASFEAAYLQLRKQHRVLCFKPAVSVFGLGFHVLTEAGNPLKRLLEGPGVPVGVDEVGHILEHQPQSRELLVMQYLPGPERSVDCLGQNGDLLRCVVRRKATDHSYAQWLEQHPRIEEMVRFLTAHFRLSGIYNIQFKEADGVPYLLEINPRMSGGLHYACLSGFSFPYWGVRLALGALVRDELPQPCTGFRVGQVNRAIRL